MLKSTQIYYLLIETVTIIIILSDTEIGNRSIDIHRSIHHKNIRFVESRINRDERERERDVDRDPTDKGCWLQI